MSRSLNFSHVPHEQTADALTKHWTEAAAHFAARLEALGLGQRRWYEDVLGAASHAKLRG